MFLMFCRNPVISTGVSVANEVEKSVLIDFSTRLRLARDDDLCSFLQSIFKRQKLPKLDSYLPVGRVCKNDNGVLCDYSFYKNFGTTSYFIQLKSFFNRARWKWRRFSAWSRIIEFGDSKTSSVISRPRLAGRQCIILASGGADLRSSAFT